MKLLHVSSVALLVMLVAASAPAQVSWMVGGNTGLSVADGSAGFHIGPMGEVLFSRNIAVGTEFSINTQAGTPVLWYNYFKYYFSIPGSEVMPYANAGMLLDFVTGGPYFGLFFGGGVNIPVIRNLYISPEFQGGPIFSVGGGTTQSFFGNFTVEGKTIFAFVFRGGIRYYIP
jgi:hypothetical protein